VKYPYLQQAYAAFGSRDQRRLTTLAAEAAQNLPDNVELLGRIQHLHSLLGPRPLRRVADLPAELDTAKVPDLQLEHISVGWGSAIAESSASGSGPKRTI
jgi:hypothetical protein